MNESAIRALERADMAALMALPAFRRFLFRLMRDSQCWASIYGADGRHLPFAEGRRTLALEILGWAEAAQPAPRADAATTISAVLAEAMRSIPEQDEHGGSDGYDRRDE